MSRSLPVRLAQLRHLGRGRHARHQAVLHRARRVLHPGHRRLPSRSGSGPSRAARPACSRSGRAGSARCRRLRVTDAGVCRVRVGDHRHLHRLGVVGATCRAGSRPRPSRRRGCAAGGRAGRSPARRGGRTPALRPSQPPPNAAAAGRGGVVVRRVGRRPARSIRSRRSSVACGGRGGDRARRRVAARAGRVRLQRGVQAQGLDELVDPLVVGVVDLELVAPGLQRDRSCPGSRSGS